MTIPPREPPSKDRTSSAPRPARTALELDIMRDEGNVRSLRQPPQSVRTVIEFDRGRAATRSIPPLAQQLLPTGAPSGATAGRPPSDTETRRLSGERHEADDEDWSRPAQPQRAVTHSVALPIVPSSADLPTRELPEEQVPPLSDEDAVRGSREQRWPLPSEAVALDGASWADQESKHQPPATAAARTVVVRGAATHAPLPPPPLPPTLSPPPLPLRSSLPPPPLPPASIAAQQPSAQPASALSPALRRAFRAAGRLLLPLATFLLGVAFALQFGDTLRARFTPLFGSAATPAPAAAPEVSVLTTEGIGQQRAPARPHTQASSEDAAARPEVAMALYIAGQREQALALYRRLARAHPEARVYAEVARILERELAEK